MKIEIKSNNELIKAEKEWFKINEFECPKCDSKKDLTIDHIIPKKILIQFGINVNTDFFKDNLGILCRKCNVFKADRLDFSNKKTKKLLINLLKNC